MNAIRIRQFSLLGLILATAALALIAWAQRPEAALLWLTGMLSVPLAWLAVVFFGVMPGPDRPAERTSLYNSLLGAGALITAALAVTTAVTLDAVPEDWSTRFGMLSGALILIVIGNALPKKVEPGCSRTRGLKIQRLLGWTFVITGLVATPIWLIAPIGVAQIAGLSVYAVAAVFSLIAVARLMRGPDIA
jgi:hypothetical protein